MVSDTEQTPCKMLALALFLFTSFFRTSLSVLGDI